MKFDPHMALRVR